MTDAPSLFDAELIGAAVRALLALGGLIALGAFAIWFQRRQRGGVKRIRISDRLLLTRGSSILLLDVEGKRLLVGVTPEAIRLITPLEESLESLPEQADPLPFSALLQSLVRRKPEARS